MKDVPYCFACQFFVPEGMLHNELEDADDDRYMTTDGECHCECPKLVTQVIHDDGYTRREHTGQWPMVQGFQWCGQFSPKHHSTPSDHPTLKITS
ncbi:MAG TPA: hypothetical protein DER01_02475 [Phycisphaerales bacterium]|nr:hypothetical protein [Phycisphaerales bacterium]|tara:strand:- start:33 stop:317 length:285 start_codon:yes stop_codon:yes gene_type:complete